MIAFLALTARQIVESRWTLILSALVLFAMNWPLLLFTAQIQSDMKEFGEVVDLRSNRAAAAFGGVQTDGSAAPIEVMLWNHPFVVLTFALWAISRGSSAVSAEIERGTLDIVLSRPIARSVHLGANVAFTIVGIVILAGALLVGNRVGHRLVKIDAPPSLSLLLKPAANIMALGVAIYGYTIIVSSKASVRWKPIFISTVASTVATLGGYIVHILVNLPGLDAWKPLDRYTIFHAFDPVELVTKGETFGLNMAILAGIATATIAGAFLTFAYRDLPANS
jgi:ABC-2 type transport system permease protein